MNSIFWVGLILYVALPPFQSSPQANPLPPLQYTITMIKDLPWGGIVVTSLNDRGQGVGFAYRSAVDASCCEKGFVWDNGKAFLLRPLSGRYTIPLHINNRGDIVGVSETIRWKGIHFEDEEIRLFPVIWESVGSLRKTVSRFPVALSTEEGGAYGINDQGEIVGSGRASNERGSYPCYWKSRDIQKLSRASGSRGVAINERGDYITDGSSNGYPSPVGFLSLISQGKSLPLKGLGGKFAILHGLNNSGAVVGTCDDTSDYPRACLWKDKTPIELESLGGRGRDVAYGINDAGLIVGRSTLSSGKQVACLWQNRKATPLSSLLTNATGWKLEAAQAINNKNQIAGIGSYRGKSTAFLMTPTRASAQKSNRPLSQLPSYSILDGATHYGRYHWVSSTIIQIEIENGDQNLWSVAEHKFVHREAVRRINRRFRGDQLFFSPDCMRVLVTDPGRNKGYCVSLKGKQTLSFRGFEAQWFDSHRWGAIRSQENSGDFVLEIRNVLHKKILTHSFKRKKAERNFNLTLLSSQQIIGDPLLISWGMYNRSQSPDDVELSVWNSREKGNKMIFHHTKTPDGQHVSGPIAFSPDGKKIVWETLVSTKDGKLCACFWVTDIDGKNAFAAKQVNFLGTEERPHHSRWLPDNKNFSFIHKNRLYIVPAQNL